tara:strand:+ start:79 stop:1257 length:1179 start_codon:yes stop_codon:yes gene_type:complete
MPWKESNVLHERIKFVNEAIEGQWSVTDLCRKYGISRKTGYKFLERFRDHGLDGLMDRSRAPESQPNRVSGEMIDTLIDRRIQYPTWGPRKVLRSLQRENPAIIEWPAISTVGEIFKRHGLVKSKKKRRPNGLYHRGPGDPANRPNQTWCADHKGPFRTADGYIVNPLTVSDEYSRFLLGCQCMESLASEATIPAFKRLFQRYGMPDAIRTDNGSPFASAKGLGGFTPLSVWWVKLGVTPQRIQPGKPQQNGAHERMHRTLKNETANPAARDRRSQQRSFDRFRKQYNEIRPHEALDDDTPAMHYSHGVKPFPSRIPEPNYPGSYEVKRVRSKGSVKLHGTEVFITSALDTEWIAFEQISDLQWRVHFYHLTLGVYDLGSGKWLHFPAHHQT